MLVNKIGKTSDVAARRPSHRARRLSNTRQGKRSHSMNQIEPSLVRELRKVLTELQERVAAQERQIDELRGAIVALMEPDMPRVLRTPGGIIVLDKSVNRAAQ